MVLLLSSEPCCEVNGAALAASFFETLAGGLAQPRAANLLLGVLAPEPGMSHVARRT